MQRKFALRNETSARGADTNMAAKPPVLVEIIELSSLGAGNVFRFFSEVFNDEILISKQDDQYVAVSGFCPHFGGPLECRKSDYYCPWHGLSFNKETLKSERGQNELKLSVYKVEINQRRLVIKK